MLFSRRYSSFPNFLKMLAGIQFGTEVTSIETNDFKKIQDLMSLISQQWPSLTVRREAISICVAQHYRGEKVLVELSPCEDCDQLGKLGVSIENPLIVNVNSAGFRVYRSALPDPRIPKNVHPKRLERC